MYYIIRVVFNPTRDFQTFEIEKSECDLVWHGFDRFPSDSESTIANIHYGRPLVDCKLRPGTSGSTILNSSGNWVALHYAGYTNHTKDSGYSASDFGLISHINLKTGVHIGCVPVPGGSVSASCKNDIRETNKRVRDKLRSLDSGDSIGARTKGFETSYNLNKASLPPFYYSDLNFDEPLFSFMMSKPKWYAAFPRPDCVSKSQFILTPVCYYQIQYSQSMEPTGFTFNNCEMKTAFTLSDDANAIYFEDGGSNYITFPYDIPTC